VKTSKIVGLLTAGVLISVPLSGVAAGVAKGQNEVAGLITYADVDYGDSDSKETDLRLSYGRYLTDMHEIGVSVGYFKQELGDEDFGSVSVDGSTLGVFYHLNFPTSGTVTPYIGVNGAWLGGDISDAYDFQYGVSAGIKIYPFEHAGFSFGASYQKLNGAESYIDDADGISVAIGLLVRF